MPAQAQRKYYQNLQKIFSRRINLDRRRINLALKKLGNVHSSIKNPINILGSDGKFSDATFEDFSMIKIYDGLQIALSL